MNNYLSWFKVHNIQQITIYMELKVEKIVQELIEIIALLAINYEYLLDFDKVLECWSLATWLSEKLLLYDESNIF